MAATPGRAGSMPETTSWARSTQAFRRASSSGSFSWTIPCHDPDPFGPGRRYSARRGVGVWRGRSVTEDLVALAQAGDHAAFGTLAGAAIDRLYAIAHRVL